MFILLTNIVIFINVEKCKDPIFIYVMPMLYQHELCSRPSLGIQNYCLFSISFFIVDLKMWSLILMASMIQSRIVCNWLCRWLQTKRKTICNFRFCIIFEPNILSNVRITKNQEMMRWDFNNHLIKYKTCVILNTVGGIEANWIKMWMLKMHLSHVLLRHIHF